MKFTAIRRTADEYEEPVELEITEENGVTAVRPHPDVRGPRDLVPLDPECGVRILIDPETPVRYMADRRHSEFWCSPFFGNDLTKVPCDTQYFLYRTDDGRWGVIVPVVDRDFKCVLEGTEDGLTAKQFSWNYGPVGTNDLAFVWAEGDDPFELTERAVRRAADLLGTILREDRRYPEVFEYLGWCSWDALQIRVSEAGLLEKADEFREKGIPVKWVILDDMWAEIRNFVGAKYETREEMFRLMHSSSMSDYEAASDRFPDGLAHAVAGLHAYGMKVGIWHPSTGYWYGLDPAGEAYRKLRDFTTVTADGRIVSDWHAERAFGFFSTMHRFFRESGADFLKVDNQSMTRRFYKGMDTVGRVTREWHRGLEGSVGLHFDNTMINCMGMASEDLWNRGFSSICRCSDDFQPENRPWFTKHILQCAYNSILQGQLFWNDYDMWWTDDTQAVKNSVLRAVSGGPIYVSDEIGRSRPEILKPLAFEDGRILRCDRSGMPTADCLLDDPRTSGKPFKVQNRIGRAGVVAAFHIAEEDGPLEGILRPSDVPGLEGEEFVVYEYFTEGRWRIPKDGELHIRLLDREDMRIYTLIPYENGFAPIGRTDKFLPYAAITSRIGEAVTLYEPGPYAYIKDGKFYEEDRHA